MKRYNGFKTIEEAEKVAETLLVIHQKGESVTTTSRKGVDQDGNTIPFFTITNQETGAMSCVCGIGDGFTVIYLTAEEVKVENRTYPYRAIKDELIPFLLALRTPIFKPVTEIPADAIFTPENVNKVNAFFGSDYVRGDYMTKEQISEIDVTIDNAFEEWTDDEGNVEITSLIIAPYPETLSQITGIEINDSEDYIKGIEKMLGAELNEMQEDSVRETYLYNSSSIFMRYAIYEFFRTEDYPHLKSILQEYGKSGLPHEWERETYLLPIGVSAEIYALSKYIAMQGNIVTGNRNRIKDIAEYTNTPLSLMFKASRIQDI